ncbi:glycine betaine ABC transporter substrate-binding protein [Texcoconibacillus texcoconensis]|uniref:Glycine betaine/proline transport system substrate-binding protein n=1 Tax=Texcoconibacillus texcoconensis TaxID=1095777 RepID=A0A840QU12_9BACI|nr:glycine betaine ABC transporter substrate-binding protein [Texcoconibacillus texcoconensis]MBB5174875.1 glycine betaine/proline transport system substrate-binding protein [Texcoconibacillus texcoconensis]
MKKYALSVTLSSLLIMTACAGGETETKGDIHIGLNNWAENIAVSNMWAIVLEEEGYDVQLTMSEKSPIWTGVAAGEIDIAPEIWLPTTDEPLYEDYQDDIVLQDIWYEGTELGLGVPEYVDVDSIDELNDHVDKFDGRIVGIDPGSSLVGLTEDAVEEYGLDYDLRDSSESTMITELDNAYEAEEPIVATLWSPHWLFAEYDLKYLEDPEGIYGEPDDIYYMTRLDFENDHPEVVEWMNNWYMDDETLGDLMSTINELDDEEAGAEQWIEENRDLVDEWLEK